MELTCIIVDDEPHAVAELSELIEMAPGINTFGSFSSVREALVYFENGNNVDVIFCDISMPEVDGLQAAPVISKFCKFLVFVTAHRFHGPEAYEVRAAGYLLKPLKYEKLIKLVDELCAQFEQQVWKLPEVQTIFIKGSDKNSVIAIDTSNIIYVEGMENYIKFHTTLGEKVTYMQLKDLDDNLMKTRRFLRIAKSTIISLNYLEKVDGYMAFMKTGEVFSIGKVYRPNFLDFITQRRIN